MPDSGIGLRSDFVPTTCHSLPLGEAWDSIQEHGDVTDGVLEHRRQIAGFSSHELRIVEFRNRTMIESQPSRMPFDGHFEESEQKICCGEGMLERLTLFSLRCHFRGWKPFDRSLTA
jgi:hypothetical protein